MIPSKANGKAPQLLALEARRGARLRRGLPQTRAAGTDLSSCIGSGNGYTFPTTARAVIGGPAPAAGGGCVRSGCSRKCWGRGGRRNQGLPCVADRSERLRLGCVSR